MSDSDITQAGAGEELPEAFTRNALLFIINAHAATVNMRLYPPTSSMVTETFDKAREALDVSFEYATSINVATIENNLMINNVRLPDIEQQKAPVRSFVAWMNERGLSTIEFRQGLTGEELQTFFSILSGMSDVQDRTRLTDDLKEQGVEHVSVNQRVYVAVTTSDSGEIIGGVQGSAAPLDALKDELLMRYLMGKVDLGTVEDRELVDVLSDAGKVGGLLSRFLGEEGSEGGVFMKSQKAEEALSSLSQMVEEIDDDELRQTMGDQITRVIAEMSPREMTSVLSGRAPENLNIRHVRENVITMLSDNQLLDMIDSLIDDYVEMKDESGELETEWTRQRLKDLNELLSDVRGERGESISEAIDQKLDEAGIQDERDPHTGTRVLSAYQMLGGPLEEEDVDLGEGVDQTVPRQIRQLYAMDESDLAAGMLLKLMENLSQESDAVRRYAGALVKETIDGLDEEHALVALEVVRPRIMEDLKRESDYQAFVMEMDIAAKMAELFMKSGRTQEASQVIEVITAERAEGSEKGEELLKYAEEVAGRLMGPEGMVDVEAILLEDDVLKREKTVQALAAMGPGALAPLVDMVKDRGQIELRDRALEAIQMAGEPGTVALLGELEKENPWYIYRNILNVVADLRLETGLPQVTAMAQNPDERIRREAVRSLARIGSPDSIQTVLGAANDQSVAVRRTAVRVLGMFGDRSVSKFLVDIINGQGLRGKDEDQGVVEAACLALGDLRDGEFVPQLADLIGKGGLFKKSRPEEIRAAACIALGNLGDESARGVLEKAAKDPSVMVRSSAEKGLRRLEEGPAGLEAEAPAVAAPDASILPAASDAVPAEAQPPGAFEPLFPPPPPAQQAPAEPAKDGPPPSEPLLPPPVIAQEWTPPAQQVPPEPRPVEPVPAGTDAAGLPTDTEERPPVGADRVPEPAAGYPAVEESVVEQIDWDEPVPGGGEPPEAIAPDEGPAGESPAGDPTSLEYLLTEQASLDPGVERALEDRPPHVSEQAEENVAPADPSTLEQVITEQGAPASVGPGEVPDLVEPPSREIPASSDVDESTLEGMLLGGSGQGAQDEGAPSTIDILATDEDARSPARLTLEPPSEEATPGHTSASDTRIPPELADLWPEGSLNGHDYPVPPRSDVGGEGAAAPTGPRPPDDGRAGEEGFGSGDLVSKPSDEQQGIEGLPDDDFAPGRTDQPSTMERLLGSDGGPPGTKPVPPVDPQGTPPEPPAGAAPPSPPPPSGWK